MHSAILNELQIRNSGETRLHCILQSSFVKQWRISAVHEHRWHRLMQRCLRKMSVQRAIFWMISSLSLSAPRTLQDSLFHSASIITWERNGWSLYRWHPWNEQALAEAKTLWTVTGKWLFLSFINCSSYLYFQICNFIVRDFPLSTAAVSLISCPCDTIFLLLAAGNLKICAFCWPMGKLCWAVLRAIFPVKCGKFSSVWWIEMCRAADKRRIQEISRFRRQCSILAGNFAWKTTLENSL